MIHVQARREPERVALVGPLTGASLTVRSLGPAAFDMAQQAAEAIVADDNQLLAVMTRNDLLPEGGEAVWRALPGADVDRYLTSMVGLSSWLAAVEVGMLALDGWSGVHDKAGKPVPISREAIEAAMLSTPFHDQALAHVDRLKMVHVSEGATQ